MLLIHLFLCMPVYTHTTASIWHSEDNWQESILSFQESNSGHQVQWLAHFNPWAISPALDIVSYIYDSSELSFEHDKGEYSINFQ